MDDQNRKKKIVALSKAEYRGIFIYEIPLGFGIFLGVEFILKNTLQAATDYIDQWFDLKKN